MKMSFFTKFQKSIQKRVNLLLYGNIDFGFFGVEHLSPSSIFSHFQEGFENATKKKGFLVNTSPVDPKLDP